MSLLTNIENKLGIRWQDKGLYEKLCSIIPDFENIGHKYTKTFEENGNHILITGLDAERDYIERSNAQKALMRAAFGESSLDKFTRLANKFEGILSKLTELSKSMNVDNASRTPSTKIDFRALVELELGLSGKINVSIIDMNKSELFILEVNHYKKEAKLENAYALETNGKTGQKEYNPQKPVSSIAENFIPKVFGEEFKGAFKGSHELVLLLHTRYSGDVQDLRNCTIIWNYLRRFCEAAQDRAN